MSRSRRFLAGLVIAILCLTSCAPAERSAGGEIHLRFVVPRDLPLEVSVHRPLSTEGAASMRVFEAGEIPDLGVVVAGGDIGVEFDVPQRLILVVRNPLERPVRFWSAPHLPTPHSAEPALAILCFCTGETYEVPAGGTWTRAIEVGIRRRQSVEQLVVTHVITEGPAPALPSPGQR